MMDLLILELTQQMYKTLYNRQKVNDYITPGKEIGWGRKHFVIKYKVDKNAYFIKDLIEGTGTFIKIASKTLIKDHSIYSFADINFTVAIRIPEEKNQKTQKLWFN